MLKKQTQTIGFFILLALAGWVVVTIFWPFWELLAFAIILAILFHPMYGRILGETNMPNLSAGFVVVIMALIIAGPVLFIGQQVFYELSNLYQSLHLGVLATQPGALITSLPQPIQHLAATLNVDVNAWLQQITGQAFGQLSGLLSSLGWFFGSLIVVTFSTFFLLRDGNKIKKLLMDLLPLSEANENILVERINSAVSGVVRGQFLVVLIISTVAFLGFSLFGLPNALLWACVMFVAAFVPTFGTSLVWLPAIIYLYLSGHVGAAIGMALWAWTSVVVIDNILAAKLVSARVQLHPLLTIFAILGGITTFGVFGVLLGPIFVAIFVALLEIYRLEVKGSSTLK